MPTRYLSLPLPEGAVYLVASEGQAKELRIMTYESGSSQMQAVVAELLRTVDKAHRYVLSSTQGEHEQRR
jgi:hypothetical protein